LGGAVNFAAIKLFEEWLPLFFSPRDLFWFVVGLVTVPTILFLVPIALSLGLTRLHPEKRLVPPLYIQLITFGAFLVTADYAAFPYLSLLMIGLYASLGGLAQDKIVTAITGLSVDRDSIVCRAFEVASDSERVAQVLTKFRYVGVGRKLQRKTDGTIVLRSPKDVDYTTIMEIRQGAKSNQSLLSVAFFEKSRYYLRKTQDLEEYAEIRIAYLRSLFSRAEYCMQLHDAPPKIADPLLDSIIDEMQGILSLHVQRLSRLGWVKLFAFVGAVATVGVYLFYMKDYGSAVATIALILLYLAFELPSRLSRD
jgi:hypothetical protein